MRPSGRRLKDKPSVRELLAWWSSASARASGFRSNRPTGCPRGRSGPTFRLLATPREAVDSVHSWSQAGYSLVAPPATRCGANTVRGTGCRQEDHAKSSIFQRARPDSNGGLSGPKPVRDERRGRGVAGVCVRPRGLGPRGRFTPLLRRSITFGGQPAPQPAPAEGDASSERSCGKQ